MPMGISLSTLGVPFQQNVIAQILGGASFFAPLTHTAIPIRSNGETATFTRATTKTINNNDGYLVTLLAGEIGFPGARRVHNIISQDSEDISGWSLIGTASALGNVLSMPADGDGIFVDGLTYSSVLTSRTFVMKVEMSGTGTIAIQLAGNSGGNGSGYENVTLSATPTWFELAHTFPTTVAIYPQIVIRRNGTTATSVTIDSAQLEDVTAQTTQTAGEYVSVGVESAPYYHGSMVDGVKCFPTDLAGAALPTAYTYDAVSLNGVAGTYVSTPDSVAASITGDIDIRVKVALTDWTPSIDGMLVSKLANSGQFAYDLYVDTGGLVYLRVSVNGSAVSACVSTSAVPFANGAVGWVRVTRAAASGNVNFYTSLDGDSWTQLGNPDVATTAGALHDGTDALGIGGGSGTGGNAISGRIYAAQIYNGIDGTLAVDFDASRYAGGTTLTGSTGETWTLQGNAVIHPTNSPNTGYLAESARTNLCLQSNAFTTTWLTLGSPTITQNVVGPDGATSAWTLTDATAADFSRIYQNITLTAATHTLSLFVKKAASVVTNCPLMLIAQGANIAAVTMDNYNGVATVWTSYGGPATVTSSARCSSYNDDYWRFELTFLATAAAWTCFLYPCATSSATQASGVEAAAPQGSAVFYGAQVELGSSASAYIPTTTAAVTRAADVLTYPVVVSGSNSIYAEVTPSDRENFIALVLDDGTTNNREFFLDSTVSPGLARFFVASGGATQADIEVTTLTSGVTFKAAGSVATNSAKFAVNGTLGTEDTSVTVPAASTTLHVGTNTAGAALNPLTIRNVRIWQRQLSASEMQAITA